MFNRLKQYTIVRTRSDEAKPYVEVVSAPSKRALRSYYLDWDYDEPEVSFKTLLIKRVKE